MKIFMMTFDVETRGRFWGNKKNVPLFLFEARSDGINVDKLLNVQYKQEF